MHSDTNMNYDTIITWDGIMSLHSNGRNLHAGMESEDKEFVLKRVSSNRWGNQMDETFM